MLYSRVLTINSISSLSRYDGLLYLQHGIFIVYNLLFKNSRFFFRHFFFLPGVNCFSSAEQKYRVIFFILFCVFWRHSRISCFGNFLQDNILFYCIKMFKFWICTFFIIKRGVFWNFIFFFREFFSLRIYFVLWGYW